MLASIPVIFRPVGYAEGLVCGERCLQCEWSPPWSPLLTCLAQRVSAHGVRPRVGVPLQMRIWGAGAYSDCLGPAVFFLDLFLK